MTHEYDDIIHLPRPVSQSHPRMSLDQRAAQFAPFAALTGLEHALAETTKNTQKELEYLAKIPTRNI